MGKIRVGQIGVGYWGPNLLRHFMLMSDVEVVTIADLDASRFKQGGAFNNGVRWTTDYREILEDPSIDAVVIATPAASHGPLVREMLNAGKHILVEKPLATSSNECDDLVERAKKRNLILMVGHTFLFNAAVRQIKQYLNDGDLGHVFYLYSQRLNLGRVRQDVNALWNFGPHDVSIILYLLESVPVAVSARGFAYLNRTVEDVVFLTLSFANGICAHVHLSWLDPQKVRRMTVVGSKKMLVYDDVSADSKILLYDRKVEKIPTNDSPRDFRNFAEFQLRVRSGDVVIPAFSFPEPLQVECEHFITCVRTGQAPLTDGRHGLAVVSVLEAAQRSMEQLGASQEVYVNGDGLNSQSIYQGTSG